MLAVKYITAYCTTLQKTVMDENLILARNMITANCHAMIKSPLAGHRLTLETLEADEEGNLWCWADESSIKELNRLDNAAISLKYADKENGRFMVASGTLSIMNYLSPSLAPCFCKEHSGYLCKVYVQLYEYFEKKKVAPYPNLIDSIRKYSTRLAQNISTVKNNFISAMTHHEDAPMPEKKIA